MKSRYLIIIIMIILIFLGILWLKYNSSNKEGLDENSAAALSNDIINTVNSKLGASGVDMTSYTAKLPMVIQQVTDLIEQEASISDEDASADGLGSQDLSTVVDTTGSDYYPTKSFFRGSKFSDGFCKTNTNPVELNNACSSLTAENCNLTDCCVLLQGNKCVAGNALGPTNQVDEKGQDIDYAYYSYKNQCYGSCGKGLVNAANPCSVYSMTDTGLSESCIKRLWSQSGCPNGAYITSDLVTSLKDNSKAAIQVMFKKARSDEPNYAKCYGPNESRWPVPCNATTDTSVNLSARCLTKLFTDVGCTNTDTITDAYATTNKLEPKSSMINIFTDLTTADDDSTGSLTKCYGSDELEWPDPCADVPDTANLLNGTLPIRCVGKIFKDATHCPSTDMVTSNYGRFASLPTATKNAFLKFPMIVANSTKAVLTNKFTQDAAKIQGNRFKCYGMNPNYWPDMGVIPLPANQDPCASMTPGTLDSDVSAACKTRLKGSDIFPTTNCSDANSTRVYDSYQANIYDEVRPMFDILTSTEDAYNRAMAKWCGTKQEYLLGVGQNNLIYLKPVLNLTQTWGYRPQSPVVYVISMIQIQDGTFLAAGTDKQVYSKASLDQEDKYTLTPESCCILTLVQLNDGTIVTIGGDGNLYKHKAGLISNSMRIDSITLINDGQTIAGIGTDNVVYTRPATTEQAPWTQVPGTGPIRSLTQLKNGTFVGVGTDKQLYTRPTLANSTWTNIPNSGPIAYISTINI